MGMLSSSVFVSSESSSSLMTVFVLPLFCLVGLSSTEVLDAVVLPPLLLLLHLLSNVPAVASLPMLALTPTLLVIWSHSSHPPLCCFPHPFHIDQGPFSFLSDDTNVTPVQPARLDFNYCCCCRFGSPMYVLVTLAMNLFMANMLHEYCCFCARKASCRNSLTGLYLLSAIIKNRPKNRPRR